jgi:hypothetical protein
MGPRVDQDTEKKRKTSALGPCCGKITTMATVLWCALTFESLAVTLRTTRFNIKNFYVVPTLRLCVLYGSQNKQQLLPYKTLTDWFL